MNNTQPIDFEKIKAIIEKNGGKLEALIPTLQQIQEVCGYLPKAALEYVVDHTEIPMTALYGVATFYTQFRFTPVGKHLIKMCHGTACHVKGAKQITQAITDEIGIQSGETSADGLFTLETVACLGCCSLAPVIMVDGIVYGNLTVDSVRKVLRDYKNRENI